MPNWKTYESSVRLLSAILAAHPELKLNYSEIAKAFGGDCTKWAIDNRFRSLKTDAKKISDALASGLDPGNLEIPSGGKGRNPSAYYGDCTTYALDHRFRAIKKTAAVMREAGPGQSIADKYEEGVTAKAVSMRFERLRREPNWLGNSTNNGFFLSVVPKPPRTPKKKTPKKAASDEDNEDDDEAEISPSKFTPKQALNKTMGGRVGKTRTPRKAATAIPTYVESGEEDEENNDDVDEYTEEKISTIVVKPETNDYGATLPNGGSGYNIGNGFSNGNSNGHFNGYDMEGDDVFHEAPGQQYENDFDDDAV